MKNNIVCVVVTYNRKKLLYQCLNALTVQTIPTDILIIDNGSTDNTKDYILSFLSTDGIHYYNTEKNLGGAGGFNMGMRLAVETNYKYIWVMDDDTIPEKTALEKLLRADKLLGNSYGFLASSVLWTDGSICRMNIPGVSKKYLDGENNCYLEKGILSIRYASFVSVFFPRNIILDVGLPIKEFFIWNDDYEYTTRISERYNCYYVPCSRVIHKMAVNMETDIVREEPERLDRYRYGYRNSYYTARREGIEGKLKYYFSILKVFGRILNSNCCLKGRRFKMIIRGMIEGWFFHPQIEHINGLYTAHREF